MSRTRKMLVVVSVFLLLGTSNFASATHRRNQHDCVSSYELQVADILGCCGDVRQSFELTDAERATVALKLINKALNEACVDRHSPKYLALLLDQAGAYVMRARATASSTQLAGDPLAITKVLDDSNKAVEILESFNRLYPTESPKAWHWIAQSFQKAGRPWLALIFLSRLNIECCEVGLVAEFKAELLLELGLEEAASREYSRFLLSAQTSSLCGHEKSLRNIETLRRRGFSMPDAPHDENGLCVDLSEWMPYFRFPVAPKGKGS